MVFRSLAYQKRQDVVLIMLGPLRKMRHLVLLTQFMMLLMPLLHMRPLVLLPQLMLLSPLLNLGHMVLLTQFVMLLMPLLGGVFRCPTWRSAWACGANHNVWRARRIR